jgi:hypothetical protein
LVADGGGLPGDAPGSHAPDVFVSYARADRAWAEWIGWTLEAAGWSTRLQDWDFTAGSHFVAEIHRAVDTARHMVVVLSAAYLESPSAAEEWQARWAADPRGRDRGLLIVRVEECERPGLLRQVVAEDLFGLDAATARRRLLAAVDGRRRRPDTEPDFPGDTALDAPVFPPDLPAVWVVPPRIAHFTGRQAIFDELHQWGVDGAAFTALTGLAGAGKTAVALEYAYRHAAAYDAVCWIPAEQPELLGQRLAELAAALGLAADTRPEDVVAALSHRHPRWLLIFDDASDVTAVAAFRPSGGSGRILVTSRRAGWGQLGRVVEVPLLARQESVGLLRDRVPNVDLVIADRIAALVGDLPLAIEQAAGYLETTRLPAAEYVLLLESRLGEMLGRGSVPDRPGVTVRTLCDLSIRRLADDSPAAVELLAMCAYCDADAIPLSLFSGARFPLSDDRWIWIDVQLPDGPLRAAAGDPLAWTDTVAALGNHGLARREGDMISVHRLVQAATRQALPPDEAATTVAALVDLLAGGMPGVSNWPVLWPWSRRLLPHALAATRHADDTDPPQRLAELCDDTALQLIEDGQPDRALPLLRRAVALADRARGRDDQEPDGGPAVVYQAHLAQAYLEVGQADAAITLLERTATELARLHGDDHPETLTVRANLAYAYREAGRWGEAIKLYESTLATMARVHGDDHPDTVLVRHSLALAHQNLGQDASITRLERTVADLARLRGEEHPHTLAARHNLGGAYAEAGRTDEAIRLITRTLDARRRVLGDDHRDTLRSRVQLANALTSAGKADQAIDEYERVHADQRRILGDDDPDVLTTAHNLADAYLAAGRKRRSEAVDLYERTAADLQRVLGPDHQRTLATRTNLAGAYLTAGRRDEAVTLFERTVADLERTLGPNHPETQQARLNLAVAYQKTGRADEAIVLRAKTPAARRHSTAAGRRRAARRLRKALERILADRRRALGDDHPDTLDAAYELAFTVYDQGDHATARALLENVLDRRRALFGDDNPATLNAAYALARALLPAGEYATAEAMLEDARTRRGALLGDDHPDTLRAAHELAFTKYAQGDQAAARAIIEDVLAAQRRVLGNDHPETLRTAVNLASLAQATDDLPTAQSMLEEVLARRQRLLGANHPDTIAVQRALADVRT